LLYNIPSSRTATGLYLSSVIKTGVIYSCRWHK